MGYKVIVEPTAEPVTVSECKLVARMSASGLDTLIEDVYIPAARRVCEQRTGRALMTQTIRRTLDAWPDTNDIRLNIGPVQEIDSVSYLDANGDTQVVSETTYTLDDRDEKRSHWVILAADAEWPTAGEFTNAITVDYIAGYGDTSDDVPRELRLWIMAAVADMLRSGTPDVPRAFCAGLLDREQVLSV